MRIYKKDNYISMSRQVANIISAQIIVKPSCVLGLATGSTPVGAYQQLIKWYQKGDLSFEQVRSINLDEYVNLSTDHPQSYRYFMDNNLFNHVDINVKNTYVPNGLTNDAAKSCEDYNKLIQDLGGIDMQLLGIGHNGHVGFNEPEDAFELGTHVVKLKETTLKANARFFDGKIENVPTHAITMGIKNIMHAKQIVVAASGIEKADIIKQSFFGPVMPEVPASILQLHPNVILVGDSDALSKIF